MIQQPLSYTDNDGLISLATQWVIPHGDTLVVTEELSAWEYCAHLHVGIEDSHQMTLAHSFMNRLLAPYDELVEFERRGQIMDMCKQLCNLITESRETLSPKVVVDNIRAYMTELYIVGMCGRRSLTRCEAPLVFNHRDMVGKLAMLLSQLQKPRNVVLAALQRITGDQLTPNFTEGKHRQIEDRKQ